LKEIKTSHHISNPCGRVCASMLILALISTNAPKSMYIWWCSKGAFYGSSEK
jgi:hypothetical protein